MKKGLLFFPLLAFVVIVTAQTTTIDSLKKVLVGATNTQRADILIELTRRLPDFPQLSKDDSIVASQYNNEALRLSKRTNYTKGIGKALFNLGFILLKPDSANNRKAVAVFQAALPFLEKSGEALSAAMCMEKIAGYFHVRGDYQQAIRYIDSATYLYQKAGDKNRANDNFTRKGHYYLDIGDYPTAYRLGTEALKRTQAAGDTLTMIWAIGNLSYLFLSAGLPETTIEYMHKIIKLYPTAMKAKQNRNLPYAVTWGLAKGGEAFLKLKMLDSATLIAEIIPANIDNVTIMSFLGHRYTAEQHYDTALAYYQKGFQSAKETGFEIMTAQYANDLAQTYLSLKDIKQALYYAKYALSTAQRIHTLAEMRNAVGILNDIYEQRKDYQKVYYYSKWYKALNDSVTPEQYRQKLSLIQVQNELESQKQQALLLNKENKIKQQQLSKETFMKRTLSVGIVVLLLVAGKIIHNNQQKQKAYVLLKQEKQIVEATLAELKLAQSQLVQSEKMASLGELTAGIAHEIQNPLNFVNNFSEVSMELVSEIEEALQKSDKEEALAIAANIKDNLQKVSYHGKRADAIVKGMLQHSQANTGKKEPTDINALADEYLRLSYYGLRAKDKDFSATIKTNYDDSIGSIEVIPQEIARVFLNLFNNAFYSLNEKKRRIDTGFEPTVSLFTKRSGDKIEIRVKDNGIGISPRVVDKIFQPFFTTKPTGQGTGLGLSLSYDIIKAHGGEIKLETKEGEGAEFIIELPSA